MQPENNSFYIVGIGASAGGLEALEKFFENMHAHSGMAFVVIQHLSPDYKSMMVEILSKHTKMRVLQAEDGMPVQPNCIYLIPHKKNMTIFHERLYLIERDSNRVPLNLPIDIFLQSLALDRGEKAIAIVLSGTGSDGTRGIRAIKEAEGMAMVQDEKSAKFDGMPKSAISTGLVDYVLPPEKMPDELLKFVQHPYIAQPKDTAIINRDEDSLPKIFASIREQTGVDFSEYKQTTVLRRIHRRMSVNQLDKISDYLKYIQQRPQESTILYKELLIGVTKFFRDTEAFEAISQSILPKIFERRGRRSTIRIWVAGCSTGEEAYSMAMLFAEYVETLEEVPDIKVFATDIDKQAIEYASAGVYPESIVADVSLKRLQRFFIKNEDKYQVNQKLRQMVIFAKHNLLKDPPFGKIDLVTCRNLLIYLQPVLQERVFSYFHFSLKPAGFLLLGNSETIGDNTYLFLAIDNKYRIYQYNSGHRPLLLPKTAMPSAAIDRQIRPAIMPKYGSGTSKSLVQKKQTEMIYQALLDEYMPPFIVVNDNYEVVHVSGEIDDYLRVPQGEMSFELTKMLREELAVVLRTATYSVFKNNKKLVYNLNYKVRDTQKNLNLHIKPLSLQQDENRVIAILFEEEAKKTTSAHYEEVEVVNIKDNLGRHIIDLEQELSHTRENLQAAIEELETSNEELQASNEELLSANEELQSTNEELQSVNEELMTVNSEYQYKIQELTDVNNDINNLLNSTHIGTVFLDENLCVKRFTPYITEEIYLMAMDVGRPIQHISHNLKYTALLEDVNYVLRTHVVKEIEVQSQRNKWYLLRILPYLTAEQAIQGAVITLADITERRRAEESRSLLAVIAESLEDAIIGESLEGKVLSWNKGAEKIFGYTALEIQGQSALILVPLERQQEYYNLLAQVKVGEQIRHLETIKLCKDGKKIPVLMTVMPIKDASGTIVGASKIVRDISDYKMLQDSLRREELHKKVMEAIPVGIELMSAEGEVLFLNKRGKELLEMVGSNIHIWHRLGILRIVDKTGQSLTESELPFNRVMRTQQPLYDEYFGIQQADKVRYLFLMSGVPLFDGHGQIYSVMFTFRDVTIESCDNLLQPPTT